MKKRNSTLTVLRKNKSYFNAKGKLKIGMNFKGPASSDIILINRADKFHTPC